MGRLKKDIKKKNVSLSINSNLLVILDVYLKEINVSRSEFIENLWKDYISDNIKK